MSGATIQFATNRNKTGDARIFGSDFNNPNDPSAVIYGTVQVAFDATSGTWTPNAGSLQIDPAPAPAGPAAMTAAAAPAPVPAPASVTAFVRNVSTLHANLTAAVAPGAAATAPGLIFVHGYNTTFLDAVKGAAQLGAQHGIANMFVFSFPSLGNIALYTMDEANAAKSHAALAGVITHLFGELQPHAQQGVRLEMLCHSLGNFVLSGAFALMTGTHQALLQTVYFRHAIHAAADVFAGAFGQPTGLAQILNLATEIEIYTNSWDKALMASSFIHFAQGQAERLGAVGPQNFGTLPQRVNWIECSHVAGNPIVDLGHSYYANSPAVVADLDQVLKGRAAAAVTGRQTAGAPNHFSIPLDTHTIALVQNGRGNSQVTHA